MCVRVCNVCECSYKLVERYGTPACVLWIVLELLNFVWETIRCTSRCTVRYAAQLFQCVGRRQSTAGTRRTRRLGGKWVVTFIQACTHSLGCFPLRVQHQKQRGVAVTCRVFPSTYVFVMQITETKLQARARLTWVPTIRARAPRRTQPTTHIACTSDKTHMCKR